MGAGEVRVLSHAVLPVVFMAASASDDDSGGSRWQRMKKSGSDMAWNAAESHRDEVLREYTGDDVSDEDYRQELETTATEAEDHDYALVPEGAYGDKIAAYLESHTDVEVERYNVPDEQQGGTSDIDGTSNRLSYREKKEVFPNYQTPFSAVRRQERKAKEEYDSASVVGKIGRLMARKQEDEDSFAVSPDYGSWGSDNPPYADMDFVTVTGRDEADDAGERDTAADGGMEDTDSTADAGGGGLGSADAGYGGEVLDEFMSTGFNEYAKVETPDGDIRYLKNGEETSQQSYAAAVQHEAEDLSELEEAGDETETVYTAAGKEWKKTPELIEDADTGEEREVIQVYENGQPRIDHGEDAEHVEEQKKRALNAFTTAQSQHAMPVYTETDGPDEEAEPETEGETGETVDPYEEQAEAMDVDHTYRSLTDSLADIHNRGGSALVVTDKTYEADIEDALNAEGFEYTVEDAL